MLLTRCYSCIFLSWIALPLTYLLQFPLLVAQNFKHHIRILCSTRMNIKPKNNSEMVSSQKNFDMKIHGLLLWASLGLLMPIGILVIRMSNTSFSRSGECSATRLRLFFYFHLILQILSALLSTAGAIMSMKSFENSFSNSHQRLGLALHLAIWVQTALGFCRPLKGSRERGGWYLLHWLLGTTLLVTGIINIYTGLQAYQRKTSNSTKVWSILFIAQISFMAAFYLFQDKWNYIQKQQGGIFGDVPLTPSSSADEQQEITHTNTGIHNNSALFKSWKNLF